MFSPVKWKQPCLKRVLHETPVSQTPVDLLDILAMSQCLPLGAGFLQAGK